MQLENKLNVIMMLSQYF